MNEVYTTKEKLLMAVVPAYLGGAMVIGWGCPEIFFGWSVWAIAGVWIGISAALFVDIVFAAVVVRLICEYRREAKERRRSRQHKRDEAVQLERQNRYVSREVIRRACGGGR